MWVAGSAWPAQDHNVRHAEAPIDVFATAASRLSDLGVTLDDIELLLLALARNGVVTGRQRFALHAACLRQKS